MKEIYIGNLSFETEEETLRSVFEKFGTVESVRIVKDRDTGRSKGFGFVEMTDGPESENAVKSLSGKTIDGRKVRVGFSGQKAGALGERKPGSDISFRIQSGIQDSGKSGNGNKGKPRRNDRRPRTNKGRY